MRIRQDLGPPKTVEITSRSEVDNREIVIDNDILVELQDVVKQESMQQNVLEEVVIQDFVIDNNVVQKFILEEEIVQLKDAGPVFAGPEGPEGPEGPIGPDLYHAWLNAGNQGTFEDFLNVVRQGLITDSDGNISTQQFVYVQSTPSDVWNINHNMGKRPSIICEDSAGEYFEPDFKYLDNNNLRIIIISPVAGKAYLN